MDSSQHLREQVLVSLGATETVTEELLRYNANSFELPDGESLRDVPANEEFVDTWRQYAEEVKQMGTIAVLSKYLPQLRFPIAAGISQHPEYVAATKAGANTSGMSLATGLGWKSADHCRLLLHATMAGEIPVMIAGDREDFVSLVRALARRNEPSDIPDSMGACMIAGYRNWHRLAQRNGSLPGTAQQLDRFILLSSGSYSAVDAAGLGLPSDEWMKLSLAIRLEHECVHYATKRLFGSMKNSLFDELLADSFALHAVIGEVKPDWLLRFLGLENFPAIRPAGRLQNYRGKPPLSEDAFAILAKLVVVSTRQLVSLFSGLRPLLTTRRGRVALLYSLAALTLEELASGAMFKQVLVNFETMNSELACAS